MREHFAARALDAEAGWRAVSLETSFRSTDAVLQAVDAVFAQAAALAGVALDDLPIRHVAAPRRPRRPGRDLAAPGDAARGDKPAGWTLPVGARAAAEPQTRLAAAIATTIRGWIDNKGEASGARPSHLPRRHHGAGAPAHRLRAGAGAAR